MLVSTKQAKSDRRLKGMDQAIRSDEMLAQTMLLLCAGEPAGDGGRSDDLTFGWECSPAHGSQSSYCCWHHGRT